jgi:predicted phosphodiesterase
MRVAVLSDVHGNLPALEAVLADVAEADVEAVVLCGDLAAGPLPNETLDRLGALPWPVHRVRGNADREMVAAFDAASAGEGPEDDPDGDGWAGRELTAAHRDTLAAPPLTLTLDVDGLGPVLFCHATPRSDTEIVLVDTPTAVYAEALAGVDVETVVCGHTHMPFDRLAGGHRVVNPGSVGMAYGPPGAYWAVLGPHVELRRTRYDGAAAAQELLARSGWPRMAEFAEENLRAQPGADEALAFFTASARRG